MGQGQITSSCFHKCGVVDFLRSTPKITRKVVMSWDVMVFNYHGQPPNDFADLPEDHKPDSLGPASSVRDAIAMHLPGVDWSDTAWGIYGGDGFSIEFNTGGEDPINSIMLHVRGGGDAITSMLQFATPMKWSLFDCSTGEFLDPAAPSHEGWEGFQAFRDKVFEQYREEEGA